MFKNPSVPPRFSQEIPSTAAQLSGGGNGAVVQGKHLPMTSLVNRNIRFNGKLA